MDALVSVVCCQRSLRRADHSCRGELQTVVCPIDVITKRPKRGGLAHLGAWPHEEKTVFTRAMFILPASKME